MDDANLRFAKGVCCANSKANASVRSYSPSLGRFIQPDTVIPDLRNSQAWNRYSYVLNSPIMYVDPSGHLYCPDIYDPDCLETGEEILDFAIMNEQVGLGSELLEQFDNDFGIEIHDNWSARNKNDIRRAVALVGDALGSVMGLESAEAFRLAFSAGIGQNLVFAHNGSIDGGWNTDIGRIEIGSFYTSSSEINVRFIIHELGHAFNNSFAGFLGYSHSQNSWKGTPYYALQELQTTTNFLPRPDYGTPANGYRGFAGPKDKWQFAYYKIDSNGEIWADMFVGWVYNKWANNAQGRMRSTTMDSMMLHYSNELLGN